MTLLLKATLNLRLSIVSFCVFHSFTRSRQLWGRISIRPEVERRRRRRRRGRRRRRKRGRKRRWEGSRMRRRGRKRRTRRMRVIGCVRHQ